MVATIWDRRTALIDMSPNLSGAELERITQATNISDQVMSILKLKITSSQLDMIVRETMSILMVDTEEPVNEAPVKVSAPRVRAKAKRPAKRRKIGSGSYSKYTGWMLTDKTHPLAINKDGRIQKWRVISYKDGERFTDCAFLCGTKLSWFEREDKTIQPLPFYIDGDNHNCTTENVRVVCRSCKFEAARINSPVAKAIPLLFHADKLDKKTATNILNSIEKVNA